MNGVTRRTFTVRSDTPGTLGKDVSYDILTVEEAMAQTRVYLVNAIDKYLHERALLMSAKDHMLVIEPMQIGNGLRRVDECTNRPCPWFGDEADYTGLKDGRKEVLSIWYFEEQR